MKSIAMLLMLIGSPLMAQSVAPSPLAQSSDIVALEQWVASQQVHAGTGMGLKGIKYASTWWDLVNIGQSGLNVAKPGALDFIDVGPSMNIANATTPRYGLGVPVHAGNIYNTLATHLPGVIAAHVTIPMLPNAIIAPQVLYPLSGDISKWTWYNDFVVTVAYSFGGS